jgi:L-ribulose-5-phosphate 4-epimerase
MTDEEIAGDYERNTGLVIAETFEGRDPAAVPAVLVRGHGVFSWGADAEEAVHNAAVLENLAMMAYRTMRLNGNAGPIPSTLLDRHFFRKHGANAYYGQCAGEI